jgi:3-dehydroshikimate dehydratase
MLKLAAFADEISPDIDEQIRVCRENGVTHIELRSVNQINVLDLDANLRREIRSKVADAGMGIVAIGSPIGKVKITEPWEKHFDRFKIAAELAGFFEAPLIRIFSYYPAEEGQDIRHHRDEVHRRMRDKVEHIRNQPVTLAHENEHAIYGQDGKECLDLMQSINSPKLRSAFDFANFVMEGEKPRDNWPLLKPYTVHIHIKDAIMSERRIVPAGEGDGDIGSILRDAWDSGYRGFLSLEPHLKAAGKMGGFSGPQLFKTAADGLKKVCREHGVPLAAQG